MFCVGQGGACAAGGAEIRGSEPACAGLDGLKSRSLWLRHVHEAKYPSLSILPTKLAHGIQCPIAPRIHTRHRSAPNPGTTNGST
jgi:hypothetical protein